MTLLEYENETTCGGANFLPLPLCSEVMLLTGELSLLPASTCENIRIHFCSNQYLQAIDDPSSNQFRDPPTYTHQPSMQQKVPFSLIRCSSSKVAFCSCVEWGWHIYNIVESESDPLTRRAVDLFEKEPLKGNSEVHLHTPTKFGEDRSKDLGGDREQTDRQTNRQTDKRCSIYSMIYTQLDDVTYVLLVSLVALQCLKYELRGRRDFLI